MTLEGIKKEKSKLESDIQNLLYEFDKKTNCFISDIGLSRMNTITGEVVQYKIDIEITL